MISSTTVLVAIVGSAIGGVVGSWLQVRHQRHEAIRERMLEAADNAANTLGTTLSATRVALNQLEEWRVVGGDSDAASRANKHASELLDGAADSAGRVDLLYGLDSGIGDALRRTRGLLRRALSEAGPSPPEFERASAAFEEAEQAYADFVRGARDAALSYGTSGPRRWVARRIGR